MKRELDSFAEEALNQAAPVMLNNEVEDFLRRNNLEIMNISAIKDKYSNVFTTHNDYVIIKDTEYFVEFDANVSFLNIEAIKAYIE